MHKPLILILSAHTADCRAITEAALSQGCRATAASSVPELIVFLEKESPLLLFCDSVPANGGETLRLIAEARGNAVTDIVLIVPFDMKPGHLKALKPWVHDYLSTPVLREAAAARIRQAIYIKTLQQAVEKAAGTLTGWMAEWESAISSLDPTTADRYAFSRDLAQRVLRQRADELDKPACLVIARRNGQGGLDCEVFAASAEEKDNVPARVTMPESALFLRMKMELRPFHANYFDKGATFKDFQTLFPPQLIRFTGGIHNLAGLAVNDGYVAAFNYGRAVSAEDALHLKGLALPRALLSAAANDIRCVSDSFLATTRALAFAADSHSDNGAHIGRMNAYAETLAKRMALSGRLIRDLSYSAQLHDVGKMFIPPALLEKPVPLTANEFAVIKRHPVLGAGILGDSPLLRAARTIALTHHECWDGTGYPAGLSGNAIPIEGAIIKVADVYDALRTPRAYRPAISHEDACRIILDGDDAPGGTLPSHFNPEALQAFRDCAGRFEEISQGAGLGAAVHV